MVWQLAQLHHQLMKVMPEVMVVQTYLYDYYVVMKTLIYWVSLLEAVSLQMAVNEMLLQTCHTYHLYHH